MDSARDNLPPDLRALCDCLQAGSLSNAARTLGIPRTTLNDRLKRLRKHFRAVERWSAL